MKDYNKQVTFESSQNFINHAINDNYCVEIIEGVLNDTYIIDNTDKTLTIKGVKPRKYIILYPCFASSWHNTFHILMTDDFSKVENFKAN